MSFGLYGENCYPPYDKLSTQERQLIKWKFVDNKKSSEIAEIVTEHPNTVREHISKVKKRVKEAIIENNMEDIITMFKLDQE